MYLGAQSTLGDTGSLSEKIVILAKELLVVLFERFDLRTVPRFVTAHTFCASRVWTKIFGFLKGRVSRFSACASDDLSAVKKLFLDQLEARSQLWRGGIRR